MRCGDKTDEIDRDKDRDRWKKARSCRINVDHCVKFLVRLRTAILSELACSLINNINDKLWWIHKQKQNWA